MSEFDLIRRLQETICVADAPYAPQCVLGIGDDAAVLDPPADRQLVVCTDSLVEGVHFPPTTPAAAVGHKVLAVNLSDLAAMGAEPAWFFLSLTLPAAEWQWLDAFAQGMAKLASEAGILLSGGDVCTGPLNVCVTAVGLIEPGKALTRSGAKPGDLVVVSGQLGAAACALQALQSGAAPAEADRLALEYPVPRLRLGCSLRGIATACIDLSDGLLADLGHVLRASGVGARLDLQKLPCAQSMSAMAEQDRWPLQLSGGDDYELCFTLPVHLEDRLAELVDAGGIGLTVIGAITEHPGLVIRRPDGTTYEPVRSGYEHFSAAGTGTP